MGKMCCPRFTHLGGNASNDSRTGLWTWNLNNDSLNRNRNHGTHVAKKRSKAQSNLATWQNKSPNELSNFV